MSVPFREIRKAVRRVRRKGIDTDDVHHLNIVAMMDMMSILLVFLLKSFSMTPSNLTFGKELALPQSTSHLATHEAVNIAVTRNAILVEGEPVVSVHRGSVDPSVKPDGANGYLISPLMDTLTKHATRHKTIAALRGQAGSFVGEAAIIADKATPYRLLTEVLYTAGSAEFKNYRLVVLQKE
jgi:biopolymer transport protein ExbD